MFAFFLYLFFNLKYFKLKNFAKNETSILYDPEIYGFRKIDSVDLKNKQFEVLAPIFFFFLVSKYISD